MTEDFNPLPVIQKNPSSEQNIFKRDEEYDNELVPVAEAIITSQSNWRGGEKLTIS